MALLRRIIPCFSLILLLLVGVLNSLRQQPPPEMIAFICCRQQNSGDIYTIWADGKSPQMRRADSHIKESLVWSANGEWLTFSILPTEYNPKVFSFHPDGTGFYQANFSGYHPIWSPDGTALALVYNEPSSNQQIIVVIKRDQPDNFQAVPVQAEKIYALHWVDNQSLVFLVDYLDNTSKAYQLTLADASITPLNDSFFYFAPNHPQWSPDSQWLVFEVVLDQYNIQIAKMRVDGSAYQVLASGGRNQFPAWSTDGKWIAFTSDRATFVHNNLYKMRADGTHIQKISNWAGVALPAWSPPVQDMRWHEYWLVGLALGLIVGIALLRWKVHRKTVA